MTERRAGTERDDPLDYETLPAFVKMQVSPKEYAWMGAAGRARLLQDLTEPDWEEP